LSEREVRGDSPSKIVVLTFLFCSLEILEVDIPVKLEEDEYAGFGFVITVCFLTPTIG